MESGLGRAILFLLAFSLLVGLSTATIGYTIDAKVGGSAFHISRLTHNLTFSLDGNISGSGNFSRYSQIKNVAGIKSNERSSAIRGGDLSLNEKERLKTIEGPVTILLELQSGTKDVTVPDPTDPSRFIVVPLVAEYAKIDIDEIWPSAYANYKKMSYFGPIVRNSEHYENNGDLVTTSIDSWKLDKESLYRANINRTVIDVDMTPSQVRVDRAMNRSSFYALNMESTGSLTHLGIARKESHSTSKRTNSRDPDILVSEDFAGQHHLTLKISMDESVLKNREEDSWLPCCSGGYLDMNKADQRGLSSDSIFNCSCTGQFAERENWP
ncbi:MAG: hypothetical protein GYA39_03620 [Methanothrix sp.]|nr:hypothetical protein [Methanothrix sp.]